MLKRTFIHVLYFCAFALISFPAFSVPAYPYFTTVIQPDGQKITVKMKGDERIKWMESEDGYSLLYDNNENIVFAVLDEKGDMTPSAIKASNKDLRSPEVNTELTKIPKGLEYSKEQMLFLLQIRQIRENMATLSHRSSLRAGGGKTKALCALIQFPDKKFTRTVADFEQLMNQPDYSVGGTKGSVRDFYLENSYGQLDLEITVAGIYTAAKEWSYYGKNDKYGNDEHPEELAEEAAHFAFSDYQPADYDNDGDGVIDAFHFLYAGYGEEAGGGANCIWAHEYGFYPSLKFEKNIQLKTYSCSPELRGNSGTNITFIGVICHELGHVLGAPDFYDTAHQKGSGNDYLGTGNWDLMANGNWNSNGAIPAHINMYQKIILGWVEPVELNSKKTVKNMQSSVVAPEAYVISTEVPNEYFVLENRQRQGFDSNVPGHGLLIYHVSITPEDIQQNKVNAGHPQKVYPVYAGDAVYAIPAGTIASYGAINTASCPFPGAAFQQTFNNASIPAMWTWDKVPVSKPITAIVEEYGLISFQFMASLFELTASVSVDKVTLNWTVPEESESIEGYKIYCNDKYLGITSENTYRNTVKENGVYIYGVSILYKNGAESEKETVTVDVNMVSIHSVEYEPTRVYPNPIERGKTLTVSRNNHTENANLLCYDLSGRLIRQMQLSSPVDYYTVDLPSGVYFIKIVNKQEIETLKLTVK